MAAHSAIFPWPSHYGHYRFFEGQIIRHGKVASLKSEGSGAYQLTRTRGDALRVFICECYAFGIAEYFETIEQLGRLDAVIINSAWCGYSPDAKRHCRDENVGLFSIGEFMGALHRDDHWAYLTDKEEEYFRKQGWL
ncbi:hypothetical protein M2281_005543 [Mesorhizobium soli]|uniref:hypothetical protein n=1 Tax=Pseudaminobacter soli (ex Li et al. 2025) TaxID=1295366 RepID=UPI0024770A98|nr:hypothetical protein [Mesorhizobium soli]MDH6234922.1 hypothetical protein [Mesorhizobium soli]